MKTRQVVLCFPTNGGFMQSILKWVSICWTGYPVY